MYIHQGETGDDPMRSCYCQSSDRSYDYGLWDCGWGGLCEESKHTALRGNIMPHINLPSPLYYHSRGRISVEYPLRPHATISIQ